MYRVFLVSEGLSLLEDVSPTASVQTLQSSLASKCGVRGKDVILLSCKGQLLDSRETLGGYDAGTEEKPVFVFFRPSSSINSKALSHQPYRPNPTLISQLNRLSTSPSTSALQHQLGVGKTLAEEAIKLCNCIHELRIATRLQYRGWQAMIHNFKSIHKSFEKHHRVFKQSVASLQESRPVYEELLAKSSIQLEVLKKINLTSSSFGEESGVFGGHDSEGGSLYDWISSQDEHSSLQDLVRECKEALDQINEASLSQLQSMSSQLIITADNANKTDSIRDLLTEVNLEEVNRITQEQQSVYQSLQSTIQRAVGSGDAGALANVSLSNNKLVQLMYNNHRVMEAKVQELELSRQSIKGDIEKGLMTVAELQQQMIESNTQLLFYSEHLQLTRRRFEVLEQICASPLTLAHIMLEIRQRKIFKREYTKLAERMAVKLETMRESEKRRRQKFLESYSQHFLLSLFPSFTDRIPHYINTASHHSFDDDLCKLTNEMIDEMSLWLPQITTPINQLVLPERDGQCQTDPLDQPMGPSSAHNAVSTGTQCTVESHDNWTQSGTKVLDLINECTQTVKDHGIHKDTQTHLQSMDASVQTLHSLMKDIGMQVNLRVGGDRSTQTDRTGANETGSQTVGVACVDCSAQTMLPPTVVDDEVQTSFKGVAKCSQTAVHEYSNTCCQTEGMDLRNTGSQTDTGSDTGSKRSIVLNTGSQTDSKSDSGTKCSNVLDTGSQTNVIASVDNSVQTLSLKYSSSSVQTLSPEYSSNSVQTLSPEYSSSSVQAQPNSTDVIVQTIPISNTSVCLQTEFLMESIGIQTVSPGYLATTTQTDLIGQHRSCQTIEIDKIDTSSQTDNIERIPSGLSPPRMMRQPSESAFWVVNSPNSSTYMEETDTHVIGTHSDPLELEPTTSPTNSLSSLEGQVVALKAAVTGMKTQLMLERETHKKQVNGLEKEMKRLHKSHSISESSATSKDTEGPSYLINIGSLKVGDTALFIQDGHSNFLALTCDGRLYYLHHSSAEHFKNDISSKVVAPLLRRKTVIGTVTEKLLVEVRKENNRLKVPVGQRLYKLSAREITLPIVPTIT